MLRRVVTLDAPARSLLEHAVDRLGISGRAHDRVLEVALTVRDLDAAAEAGSHAGPHARPVKLGESHLAEALSHRALDRLSPTEQSARDAARSGRR